MATTNVDGLYFSFHPNYAVQKYDEWQHFRKVVRPADKAAVDLVAFRISANADVVWLIEAKDFRRQSGEQDKSGVGLPAHTARKMRETLEGLADAAANALITEERDHASKAVARTPRVVLHLEPFDPETPTKMYRHPIPLVLQKLKQLLKDIDPNPLFLTIATTPKYGVPWTVS